MLDIEFDFKKLRLSRKLNGYTQNDISLLLGISQSTYARLERGEIYSWEKHLCKICEILKVKIDYFNSNETYISNFNEVYFYKNIIIEKDKKIKELENEIEILKLNK